MSPLQPTNVVLAWFNDDHEFPALTGMCDWHMVADDADAELDDYMLVTCDDSDSEQGDKDRAAIHVAPLRPAPSSYADVLKKSAPIKKTTRVTTNNKLPVPSRARYLPHSYQHVSPTLVTMDDDTNDAPWLDQFHTSKSRNRYHQQRAHFGYAKLATRLCNLGFGYVLRDWRNPWMITSLEELTAHMNSPLVPRHAYNLWNRMHSADYRYPPSRVDCKILMELTS
ncbi:hypothetical protein BC940DRAFT_337560 [Gongronella butleri]|nr:hypothetical protein BC940DRAFT_337560 [Gongronella butleri]